MSTARTLLERVLGSIGAGAIVRTGAQRRADRHRGIVERAAILYRGKKAMVAVANVSKGGVTIETGLTPDVGESLLLELPGKAPAEARVRWVKPGRVGLAIG